ncbi:HD-GYP domain-containing protein [Desulfovulcanus sp.]
MKNKNLSVENLEEEFYQISPEILSSFPKFRLPLNLYIFKEEIAQLELYYRAGERLAKEKHEEILELSENGYIFVARSDHHIYAKHICKQLDLVLVDKNLKPNELIEIFKLALTKRINNFYDQPVKPTFEKLVSDISVLIEYLWEDQYRLKGLTKNLFDSYSLPNMAYNTGIIGIALFFDVQGKNLTKKHLSQIALGLFTYDLGLARIPKFILEKKQNLTPDEQSKINNHPLNGAKILRKLDITEGLTLQCHLEHHEYMDGSGYPRKLSGADISLSGAITALAHSFSEILTKTEPTPSSKEILNQLSVMKSKFNPNLLSSIFKIFLHDLMK